MEFRTHVSIPEPDFRISHSTPMMLFGSCFSGSIGEKLIEHKFRVKVNPFGILYNPLSVSTAITRLMESKNFNQSELIFHNNLYQSFSHHGSFSSPDKDRCLKDISDSFVRAATFIRETKLFLITFGTAYIYRLRSTGEVVANCHKFPAGTFIRQRLTVEEIVDEWTKIVDAVLEIDDRVRFVFTVSPIRHMKDGAHENQISKSILHVAINHLQEKFPGSVGYFPAYEIQLDELRDYRFFSEDMVHPSSVAIDYIWKRFSESFFSPSTLEINDEWQKISRSINHRPLNGETDSYHFFLKQTLEKLSIFQQKHPQIDCSWEIKQLTEKIKQ